MTETCTCLPLTHRMRAALEGVEVPACDVHDQEDAPVDLRTALAAFAQPADMPLNASPDVIADRIGITRTPDN